jgi:hypothetical protein
VRSESLEGGLIEITNRDPFALSPQPDVHRDARECLDRDRRESEVA